MAVGARARDIRMQFLVEAIVITLAGGIAGILVGVGASYAIALFAGWPTVVTVNSILLAGVSSVMIGVFFGFYPAYKASMLSPIEALRLD
jgi:putative ABC transport system permease protein